MALSRWDPFGEMTSLRQVMDRLIDESFIRPSGLQREEAGGGFDMDVMERDDAVVVKASLPGVKPEDVDISVQNNVLTIQGETREEKESGEGRYYRRERRYGRFLRRVMLPADVDTNTCDASFENGVLTITLPKMERARSRRIAVRGADRPMIEGEKRRDAEGNGSRQPRQAEPATQATGARGNGAER